MGNVFILFLPILFPLQLFRWHPYSFSNSGLYWFLIITVIHTHTQTNKKHWVSRMAHMYACLGLDNLLRSSSMKKKEFLFSQKPLVAGSSSSKGWDFVKFLSSMLACQLIWPNAGFVTAMILGFHGCSFPVMSRRDYLAICILCLLLSVCPPSMIVPEHHM